MSLVNSYGEKMCQMSVYLEEDGKQELILENATLLEVNSDGALVTTLFAEPKTVAGALVKKIDFLAGKVVLAKDLKE